MFCVKVTKCSLHDRSFVSFIVISSSGDSFVDPSVLLFIRSLACECIALVWLQDQDTPAELIVQDLCGYLVGERDLEDQFFTRHTSLQGRIEDLWLQGWDVEKLFGPTCVQLLEAK